MPTDLLKGPPPAALARLLVGSGAFTPAERVLADLPAGLALARPQGVPHSIAQILAHMHYWQSWLLEAADGSPSPLPQHAVTGWPEVTQERWPGLVQAFMTGLERCLALCEDEARLEEPLGVDSPGWAGVTLGYALASVAQHNAHHLGQIILLRRMMEAWPPEGGGVSW